MASEATPSEKPAPARPAAAKSAPAKKPAAKATATAATRPAAAKAAAQPALTPEEREEKNRLAAIAKHDDALWLRESISLAIALSCFVIMIVLFVVFQGKLKSSWPKYISINALVSVLSAIKKPALTFPIARCLQEMKWLLFKNGSRSTQDLRGFDSASRGPWGAFLLLWKRFGYVVSLGAILSILNIAIDPFIQQTVDYQQCGNPLNYLDGIGQVSRTNTYTLNTEGSDDLFASFTQAVYTSILSPPVNATVAVDMYCAGETCLFGPWPQPDRSDDVDPSPIVGGTAYNSLAMCYETQDITQSVQQTQVGGTTNYTVPGTAMWVGPDSRVLASDSSRTIMNASVHSNISVFSFQKLFLAPSDSMPRAFAAILYPCVNTYGNSSIRNGTLWENVIKSTPLVTTANSKDLTLVGDLPAVVGVNPASGPAPSMTPQEFAYTYASKVGIDCSPSNAKNGSKTILGVPSTGTSGDSSLGYVQDPANAPPSSTQQWYDPRCGYSLDGRIIAALGNLSDDLFGNGQALVAKTSASQSLPKGPIQLQSLWPPQMDPDYTGIFEMDVQRMAYGFTAYIRQAQVGETGVADFNSPYADGVEYDQEICIFVDWAWMSLPAAVAGFTVIFFLAVMFASRKGGHGRAPRTAGSEAAWAAVTGAGLPAAMHAAPAMGTGIGKGVSSLVKEIVDGT